MKREDSPTRLNLRSLGGWIELYRKLIQFSVIYVTLNYEKSSRGTLDSRVRTLLYYREEKQQFPFVLLLATHDEKLHLKGRKSDRTKLGGRLSAS